MQFSNHVDGPFHGNYFQNLANNLRAYFIFFVMF